MGRPLLITGSFVLSQTHISLGNLHKRPSNREASDMMQSPVPAAELEQERDGSVEGLGLRV